MVLAIDIGNTNVVIGCFQEQQILFVERISTNQNATPLELAISIKTILEIYEIRTDEIEGSIISSVVPSINNSMRKAIEKIARCPVMIVGPGIKTGLQIAIDNPAQLGSDRVADAVAALHEYKPPIVIIDMGTATTLSVIDAQRRHIGGIIAPGVGISMNALTEKTAQLPKISLEPPKKCIGSNTIECMKSGILYGAAGCIDGLLDRITDELGETPTFLATGGMSEYIIPHCRHEIVLDNMLLLKGLQLIYQKNIGA
ncbi:type III pantothenate kinase [uncultured Ruminococcus sp.]|uniref:type III pantothenate kinase n=1 Tax=uncultured Ruminococcus sp. TaxID=165186 RepID=UPI00262687E5|nr:type III pantothenate kinase [uncultured Ruminococcus sp.]